MRILFIRNKISKDKCIEKNKYNRRAVDKNLFLLILLGEFIGCIIILFIIVSFL